MPPVDPRRVVGGSVWAKATSVSNDSRRIYGVDADKHWLHGVVVEVLVNRPEGSRRATTLIKAKYRVGESDKIKILGLAQLKKEDPASVAAPVEGGPVLAGQATSLVNTEPSSNGEVPANESPPSNTAPSAAQVPGTEGTSQSETSSLASGGRSPVVTCHGVDWHLDPNTELPVNGTFVRKTWKLTDQYTGTDYTCWTLWIQH